MGDASLSDPRSSALAKLNAANIPVSFGKYKTVDFGTAGKRLRQIVEIAQQEKKLGNTIAIVGEGSNGFNMFAAFCKELAFVLPMMEAHSVGDLFHEFQVNTFHETISRVGRLPTVALYGVVDRPTPLYPAPFLANISHLMLARIRHSLPTIIHVNCQRDELIDRLCDWYTYDLKDAVYNHATIISLS